MKEEFGTVLRALLKKYKITQRELAKWTEISHETINRFLAGTYKPGQSSVEAIAYCYGFSEAERITLFRAARVLPTALIEKFLEDEQFALKCWRESHKPLQVAMHTRQLTFSAR